MNDSTLGDITHRIIKYLRNEMSQTWEQEIMKATYWMLDETPGLSPEAYLRKLILGLHNKTVEKKQLLPCYIRF